MTTTPKEKTLSEMSGAEIQAGLNAYFNPQSASASTPAVPPGLPADAKQKDIDAAGEAILRKDVASLTADEQEYILRESRRVLREMNGR